jgi:hypothetical protein
MIRDRKMYVAPTPFGLLCGVAHLQTLILPEDAAVPEGFKQTGRLIRTEADRLIVGYKFDLRRNVLTPKRIPNPSAGREHVFVALRLDDGSDQRVLMRDVSSSR